MFFDSEALRSRAVEGFHWLKPTPSFEPSVSRHRSPKRPCSTLHGAGLGSRPGSFEQPIPLARQRTRDPGASLFSYKIARTTLLGSQPSEPATGCDCLTISSSNRASTILKAGLSRRFDAYYRHSAARRPSCRTKLKAPGRAHRGNAPTSPASKVLRYAERKA